MNQTVIDSSEQECLENAYAWVSRAVDHLKCVNPFIEAHLQRKSLGASHAVHDFFFSYYRYPPIKLKQWYPRFDERLPVNRDILERFPWFEGGWFIFEKETQTIRLDLNRLDSPSKSLASYVSAICREILNRPQRFGCYGLHEWAMVYKQSPDQIRHQKHQLRLSSTALATFVESQTVCCTHYDAFRFFTEEAKPLNSFTLLPESRLKMEQGGCVHANMDLYKWTTKLWPWIGSDLIRKTFLLAVECRELDMRASPYDLSGLGYEPICIENESGRKEYQGLQQDLANRAVPLREELLQFCEKFLACCKEM